MSYTKQTFLDRIVDEGGKVVQEGTVLKAEHLNHIEDGIEANAKELENKQPKGEYLTEHQKLKTINGQSLVGEGNLEIKIPEQQVDLSGYQEKLVSGKNIKTINGVSILGGGDIVLSPDGTISATDTELNEESSNAISNSAVTKALANKEDKVVYVKYYTDWVGGGVKLEGFTVGEVCDVTNIKTNSSYGTDYKRLEIDVKEGDIIHVGPIQATYTTTHAAWYILDENNILLSKQTSKDGTKGLTLKMPAGAKRLELQNNTTTYSTVEVYKEISYQEWLEESANTPNRVETVSFKYFNVRGFVLNAKDKTFGNSLSSDWDEYSYFVQVREGEKLWLTFAPNYKSYYYNIIDNRNKVIEAYLPEQHHLVTNMEITVPKGADFIVFNSLKAARPIVRRGLVESQDINTLNLGKENALIAMSVTSNKEMNDNIQTKRLTLGWCSDTHGDTTQYRRFTEYINSHKDRISGVLHTGDANRMSDTDDGFKRTVLKYPIEVPFMMTLGNHDAHGSTCGNGQQLASGNFAWNGEKYILPFLDDKCVAGPDNCYYYRDFTSQKIRVIVVNDYDKERYVNTSNWVTTTDETEIASAVDWNKSTSYAVGDIVNCRGLYLKCKVAGKLTVDGDVYSTSDKTTLVSKTSVACRYFRQEQLDFIVNALNVESGWSIIFAAHQVLDPFTSSSTVVDEAWTANNALKTGCLGLKYGQNGYILQDIISAYLNKTTLNKTYSAITPSATPLTGTLMNSSQHPDVTVNVDFTSAQGDIICHLCGHSHMSGAYLSSQMGDKKFVQIVAENGCWAMDDSYTGSLSRLAVSDTIRGGITARDCFNIISFDTVNKNIYLLRIGADLTDELTERVMAKISYKH